MRLSNERIRYLLQAYSSGNANDTEENEFLDWLAETDERQLIEEQILGLIERQDDEASPAVDWDLIYAKILARTNPGKKPGKVRGINWFWFAAAISVIICSAGLYFMLAEKKRAPVVTALQHIPVLKNDVPPGKNGAVLTLGNGRQILLDSVSDGELLRQGNADIRKRNGQITYNSSVEHADSVTYNSIATPAGRQYTVSLADGSKVWLNAASSIRFPTAFIGGERKVFITGEAYFEIAPHASMPFVVGINDKAEVRVLGTHFNINAYDNESVQRTTLLEGSIQISSGDSKNILKSGQQALLDGNGKLKINNQADTEEVIAWKNGMFQFEGATLDAIMRQLARWYDVEIEYKGTIPKHFGGTISRNVNLSQVLKMLELTGEVKFAIDGRKIIAMPA